MSARVHAEERVQARFVLRVDEGRVAPGGEVRGTLRVEPKVDFAVEDIGLELIGYRVDGDHLAPATAAEDEYLDEQAFRAGEPRELPFALPVPEDAPAAGALRWVLSTTLVPGVDEPDPLTDADGLFRGEVGLELDVAP